MRDKSRESENSSSFYEITALPLFAIVFLILSHTYAILIFLIGLKISQHTKFKHHDLHFGFFPTVFSSIWVAALCHSHSGAVAKGQKTRLY